MMMMMMMMARILKDNIENNHSRVAGALWYERSH
jgi:hypothetical protein